MSRVHGEAEVIIRGAVEADLGLIVELFEYGSLVEGKEEPTDLARYHAALHEIERSKGEVLVAEVGGRVVGVCQLIIFRHLQAKGGLCAEVESVHVHPTHRGQGIGSVLMGAAITKARALGCYRMQLTSNNARSEAHRFYEALGFEASHHGFKLKLE